MERIVAQWKRLPSKWIHPSKFFDPVKNDELRRTYLLAKSIDAEWRLMPLARSSQIRNSWSERMRLCASTLTSGGCD
jgi:hypothetical protein